MDIGDVVEQHTHSVELAKLKLITLGVSTEIARHVCHHFGLGGYPPGSFLAYLIAAIAAADPVNIARISLGYPGYTAAMVAVQNWPAGADALVAISEGQN